MLGGPAHERELAYPADGYGHISVMETPPLRFFSEKEMDDIRAHVLEMPKTHSYRIKRFKIGNRVIPIGIHSTLTDETADGYLGDLLYEAWINRPNKKKERY